MYVAAKTFRETHVHIHPEFFEISGDTYIEGCFQSEKYFKQYENTIRKELSFKTKATGKNAELLEKIKSVNAVSLHVRRGDYVSNSETLKVHGVCGLDYYERAVKHIESVIDNPHFFLFSDEPEWVQQNLTLNHPYEIINHNKGENSFEDMRLMSACNHHIIANSSFSWWGAWLNPSEKKNSHCA
ncbi:alpha-1,2-fucosyltransferase [Oscillatoria amoena NRMC-F 0135]|nr:alpha-1,2-fucosyltransferase [Oscillatoria amoena NRMC-F 0135]